MMAPPLVLTAGACAALTLAALMPAPSRPLLVINESHSLPRGLYLRSFGGPARDRIVALVPPVTAQAYLTQLGAPADAQLLKRVAAGAGERVCRSGPWLTWPDGKAMALARDRRGHLLPAWQGCHRLSTDEVLVMGDTALSFDGRYFGPVRRSALGGVYREVVSW